MKTKFLWVWAQAWQSMKAKSSLFSTNYCYFQKEYFLVGEIKVMEVKVVETRLTLDHRLQLVENLIANAEFILKIVVIVVELIANAGLPQIAAAFSQL